MKRRTNLKVCCGIGETLPKKLTLNETFQCNGAIKLDNSNFVTSLLWVHVHIVQIVHQKNLSLKSHILDIKLCFR